MGFRRWNAPSPIFHVSNALAGSLLWVPDDNVLQAFCFDSNPTLGPRNLICLTTILVNGIGELPDINGLPVFNFGGNPCFCVGLSLIEVVLASERGDRDIISRGPDVVVEESLELQCPCAGVINNVKIRAKFAFREGHIIFEEDREVKDRFDLWGGIEGWVQIRNLVDASTR